MILNLSHTDVLGWVWRKSSRLLGVLGRNAYRRMSWWIFWQRSHNLFAMMVLSLLVECTLLRYVNLNSTHILTAAMKMIQICHLPSVWFVGCVWGTLFHNSTWTDCFPFDSWSVIDFLQMQVFLLVNNINKCHRERNSFVDFKWLSDLGKGRFVFALRGEIEKKAWIISYELFVCHTMKSIL